MKLRTDCSPAGSAGVERTEVFPMSSETRKKLRAVDISCYLTVIQTFSERLQYSSRGSVYQSITTTIFPSTPFSCALMACLISENLKEAPIKGEILCWPIKAKMLSIVSCVGKFEKKPVR